VYDGTTNNGGKVMKSKKVLILIQFGSRSCLEEGGGKICEYVCSTLSDAENLLKAVDDAMGFEDYQVLEEEDGEVSA
jgi:hypothetical protein